jgi:hypothetical protein
VQLITLIRWGNLALACCARVLAWCSDLTSRTYTRIRKELTDLPRFSILFLRQNECNTSEARHDCYAEVSGLFILRLYLHIQTFTYSLAIKRASRYPLPNIGIISQFLTLLHSDLPNTSIITMRLFSTTLVLNVVVCLGSSYHDQSYNRTASIIFGSNHTITLNGNSSPSSVTILDYGGNVEGFPTFEVVSASGDTSGLEVTYSETLEVLENNSNVRIQKIEIT